MEMEETIATQFTRYQTLGKKLENQMKSKTKRFQVQTALAVNVARNLLSCYVYRNSENDIKLFIK